MAEFATQRLFDIGSHRAAVGHLRRLYCQQRVHGFQTGGVFLTNLLGLVGAGGLGLLQRGAQFFDLPLQGVGAADSLL